MRRDAKYRDPNMPTFDYRFTVDAPKSAVSAFHRDTRVLKSLTPPPIFVLHSFEPLSAGSLADFTLWFGPVPVRWKAEHTGVSESGFTDTQISGPLARWEHTHTFTAVDAQTTIVDEHIAYEYGHGIHGLFGRLLFSKPALYSLLTARKLLTRRHLRTLLAGTRMLR